MTPYEEEPEWLVNWRNEIRRALHDYAIVIKHFYCDYFDNVKNAKDIEGFKNHMLEITEAIIDRIHDKYADHMEGRRRELFNEKDI